MDVESQIACVMNLQSITEKLLFSMNLPKDISEKYNFLKQQTFQTLGLHFSPAVSTYSAPPEGKLNDFLIEF